MSTDSSLMGAINAEHANLAGAKSASSNSILEWVVQRNSCLFQESLLWYEFNVLDLTLGIQKLQDSPNKGGMMYDSIIFFFLLCLADVAYHKLKIWHIITSSFLRHYINDLETWFMKVHLYQVSFQDDFMSRHDLNCNLQSVCGCNQYILNMQDCLEMIKSFLRDHHRLNLSSQPT